MLTSLVVVVAEDDEKDFFITHRLLNNYNPTVLSASNLHEAREILKRGKTDIVLLDRRIPINAEAAPVPCSLDEWGKFIAEASMSCATLVYTGAPSMEDQDKAKESGALDYLEKHYFQRRPDQFVSRIKEAYDFWRRHKIVEGQAKMIEAQKDLAEQIARETRAAIGALKSEVSKLKSDHAVSSKQEEAIRTVAFQKGREMERRIWQAKTLGKKFGILAAVSAFGYAVWESCWHYFPLIGAFWKGYKH